MSEKFVVKDSDMISAKSLLHLLASSIANMEKQVIVNDKLTEQQKMAVAGAIEAVTDLHNLILAQIGEVRSNEAFDDAGDDHGGKFDA